MKLRAIPDVMKHILKCLDAADFLLEHEMIDTHSHSCILPVGLREEVDQHYVCWDIDDDENSTEKFFVFHSYNPYSYCEWITDNAFVRRVEIHKTGKVNIVTQNDIINVDNIMSDAWTSDGLFQLSTLYNMDDIQLHQWRDIWFTYLDLHKQIWGEYVHNKDYLRNG